MKNKKTLSMLALGLLLGGGAIGAMQVSANNANTTSNVVAVNAIDQAQQAVVNEKTTTEAVDTTVDTTVDKPEAGDTADGKEATNETDGIDHQFEGDEGNHQD